MWFKALQVFNIDQHADYSEKKLQKNLTDYVFTPCSTVTPKTWGWYPPTDNPEHELGYFANGFIMLCLKTEKKLIPPLVVKELLTQKITAMTKDGLNVSKQERMRLKDEIIQDLLPRAFHTANKTFAYIDTQHHILVIDAASPKKADDFLMAFRSTFDYKITRSDIQNSCSQMTKWLATQNSPNPFIIEDACLLQNANYQDSFVKYSGQDLNTNTIKTQLQQGFYVRQLLMSWDAKLEFVLNEDAVISKIKFLADVKNLAKNSSRDTELMAFDADFVIMTETLRAFIQDLSLILTQNAMVTAAA